MGSNHLPSVLAFAEPKYAARKTTTAAATTTTLQGIFQMGSNHLPSVLALGEPKYAARETTTTTTTTTTTLQGIFQMGSNRLPSVLALEWNPPFVALQNRTVALMHHIASFFDHKRGVMAGGYTFLSSVMPLEAGALSTLIEKKLFVGNKHGQ
ncbi:unnamed protein product [Nippostrongylus brasiliensis]|uniref:Dirigent protein n=1 Tax=Nippostrongylus brasiliensis TaxID=27835 RepID=A0A0N4XLE1_NIPBR|nr:unnamed protein product [Nippostrongylus brasiliensis]